MCWISLLTRPIPYIVMQLRLSLSDRKRAGNRVESGDEEKKIHWKGEDGEYYSIVEQQYYLSEKSWLLLINNNVRHLNVIFVIVHGPWEHLRRGCESIGCSQARPSSWWVFFPVMRRRNWDIKINVTGCAWDITYWDNWNVPPPTKRASTRTVIEWSRNTDENLLTTRFSHLVLSVTLHR